MKKLMFSIVTLIVLGSSVQAENVVHYDKPVKELTTIDKPNHPLK